MANSSRTWRSFDKSLDLEDQWFLRQKVKAARFQMLQDEFEKKVGEPREESCHQVKRRPDVELIQISS